MKNLDFKKLLVFIIIIAIIILLILFGSKAISTNTKVSEEESENTEKIINDYVSTLTEGYSTVYGGIDILFSKDKTTNQDLDLNVILNNSIKYATKNEMNIAVALDSLETMNKSGVYGNIKDYTTYNGKAIKEAAKILFDIDLEHGSTINNNNYLYNFYYDNDYDIYLVKRNNTTDINRTSQNVEYKIIEQTKKDNTIKVKMAVAYTYNNGSKKLYAKDAAGETIISEDSNEFPEEKINEFDKFTITLKKNDKEYSFESIEKN